MPDSNRFRILACALTAACVAPAWASDFGLPALPFAATQEEAQDGDEAAVAEADETPDFWSGWTRSAELGISGSSGNTDEFDLRAIFQTERETDTLRTLFRARYLYGEEDGSASENEWLLRGENDWLFPGERYFVFAFGVYEFDEFEDWDTRLQLFAGGGYDFLTDRSLLDGGNDRASLKGRLGAGVTREFGTDDDEFRPEALIGLDFLWEINEGQTFAAGTEVFPSLNDLGEIRAVSYANYDILLSEENNLTLRLGVEHEYDSNTDDADENDLKYFITILATF
ncbi:MAG: DUF481 domain-containing protein [Planctomycetota bacterium]|nr:DUF481 domain-containing protein [Phycisphaerales bacterium]